jgi:hypothetical protein
MIVQSYSVPAFSAIHGAWREKTRDLVAHRVGLKFRLSLQDSGATLGNSIVKQACS